MKKTKLSKLWLSLTCIFLVLAIVFTSAIFVEMRFQDTINWALGINATDSVGAGSIKFTSEFTKKDSNGNTLINENGKEVYDDEALMKEGDRVCKEVAKEGFVLLKNNGALPLANGSSVALFGTASKSVVTSGTGSGQTGGNGTTFAQALKASGFQVNEKSQEFYTNGAGKGYNSAVPPMTGTTPFTIGEVPWDVFSKDASFEDMTKCETAVVVFARNSGEGYDICSGVSPVGPEGNFIVCTDALTVKEGSKTGNNYLELNGAERDLLKGLKALKDEGKIQNIVVLLNTSNAFQVDFLADEVSDVYGVDAALWIGATGQSGVEVIGDILNGTVNPSGKLADTFCYDILREPSIYNFGTNIYGDWSKFADRSAKESSDAELAQKFYNVYREGIYVGYRYYETRYEDYVLGNTDEFAYSDIVAHSFGEGLSYTNFKFSDFAVTEENGQFNVTVKVTNTGDVAGKQVVQVYAQTPYSQYAQDNGIEKASVLCVGFDKTDLLQPGESQTVTVNFEKRRLATFDANVAKTYILDDGDYYITVAEGAHDAVNHILVEKDADESKMIPAQTTYTTDEKIVYKFVQDAIDTTTYATTSETGAQITTLFDEADINRFDNGSQQVSYVTRKDWKASFDDSSLETMLASKVALNINEAIYQGLINEQFEKPADAAQYKMPTMKAENGLVLADFVGVGRDETITKRGKTWTFDDLLDQMSYVEMRNLVLLGQHNTKNVASIAKPATSDQNGPCGFASTFVSGGAGTAFPSSTLRATTWNKGLVYRVGEIIGEDGLHSGSNGLYGPGANIHRNAFCGRNYEYYSEDPTLSALIGSEECKGVQSRGIIVYEKHFALNDSESHREGVGTWSNEQAIREIYLEAFKPILSKDGGNAHAIMTGFNRLGTTWTGDNVNLIEKVARGEWGFDGFSCTDMDNGPTAFMYAPRAVCTGTDIYDGPDNPAHPRTPQLNEFKEDPYVVSKLRESAARIVYAVGQSAAMNGIGSDSKIVEVTPWYMVLTMAAAGVMGVLTIGSAVMLFVKKKKVTIEVVKD